MSDLKLVTFLLERNEKGIFVRDEFKKLISNTRRFKESTPHNTCTSRKFLCYFDDTKETLHLIVGPSFARLGKIGFYFHQDIHDACTTHLPKDRTVAGGGELTLHRSLNRRNQVCWNATSGNYSEAFGKFSPEVLRFHELIAKRLRIAVKFEWNEISRAR